MKRISFLIAILSLMAGVCIALDSINWKLYRQVIEYETGDKLTCREGRVRITGCQTHTMMPGRPI